MFRRTLIALFAFLVMFQGIATAQMMEAAGPDSKFPVPEQTVVGADKTVPLGDLVILKLSKPKSVPMSLASSTTQWKLYEFNQVSQALDEKEANPYEGGIFFGAGIRDRKLFVQAVVTHLYIVKEPKDGKEVIKELGTRTVIYTTTVTIGSPTPGPGPAPVPPAPLPDGKFGLAKGTYELARANVSGFDLLKGSPALAANFKTMAAKAASNSGTLEQFLKDTASSNNSSLVNAGASLVAWDKFFEGLYAKLAPLSRDRKLVTLADHAAAWLEISQGLEAIK